MPPKKSAIEKNVIEGQKENAINKRVSEYSLRAVRKAKDNFKEQPSKPIKYGKNSLLDKIISSNIKENEINKRLEQISYSAINGERQKEETYKPEGVQMLGTLGREKPLGAITKEMIKEYQEEEQKPYIIDGEARKYMKTDFKPLIQVPQSIDDIKDDLRILYSNKMATIKALTDAEETINDLDDYYRGLMRDINVFGYTTDKRNNKLKAEEDMVRLRSEYDKLKIDLEKIEYEMKRMFELGKEIKKENALIPQKNKEEILRYEEALKSANQNRLNIQQQANESDAEYYQRLRDIETQKYDPILYKQYSINKVSKELKPKLEGLFKDEGMIENIIKSLSIEDKMIINKNFYKIEEDFIRKHGFNPSMNTKTAIKEMLSSFEDPATKIKALIKRINAQNLYIPELKAKQEAENQSEAIDKLKSVFKRKKIEPKYLKVIQKSREIEDNKTKNMISAREKQQEKMDELALTEKKKKAISKLSSAIKRQQAMKEYETDLEFSKNFKKSLEKNKQKELASATDKLIKARDKQQEKMDKLATEQLKKKKAIKKLEDAIKTKSTSELYKEGLLGFIRPVQKIQGAIKRVQPEPRLISEQIRDNALINRELKRIEEEKQQDAEVEKEMAKVRRLREIRARQAMRKLLRAQATEKGMPSPVASSFLSGADTEQEARERQSLRFPRSDLGVQRMPYATKKNIEKASKLQAFVRGNIAKRQYDKDISRKRLEDIFEENEQARQQLEIEEARAMMNRRAKRSDAGKERAKYDTKKARDKAFRETLTPAEKRLINVGKRAGKTTAEILDEIRQSKQGSGIKKIIPTKKTPLTAEEKSKNRLRLVIAQIQAGNDNPRLILELNKLYKKLYKIDNAYLMLKIK